MKKISLKLNLRYKKFLTKPYEPKILSFCSFMTYKFCDEIFNVLIYDFPLNHFREFKIIKKCLMFIDFGLRIFNKLYK